MKTYRVTGGVEYCIPCPHCDGHFHITPVDTLIEADSRREAVALTAVMMGGDAKPDLAAHPATLADLERKALAEWNAHRPMSNPFELAQARGEL